MINERKIIQINIAAFNVEKQCITIFLFDGLSKKFYNFNFDLIPNSLKQELGNFNPYYVNFELFYYITTSPLHTSAAHTLR